jgi:hypothetical protein
LGAKSEPTITQTIKHQGSSHPVNMNFLDRYIVFSSKGRVYYFRKLRQKVVTYQPLVLLRKLKIAASLLCVTRRKSGNWYDNRKSDAQRKRKRTSTYCSPTQTGENPYGFVKIFCERSITHRLAHLGRHDSTSCSMAPRSLPWSEVSRATSSSVRCSPLAVAGTDSGTAQQPTVAESKGTT